MEQPYSIRRAYPLQDPRERLVGSHSAVKLVWAKVFQGFSEEGCPGCSFADGVACLEPEPRAFGSPASGNRHQKADSAVVRKEMED